MATELVYTLTVKENNDEGTLSAEQLTAQRESFEKRIKELRIQTGNAIIEVVTLIPVE